MKLYNILPIILVVGIILVSGCTTQYGTQTTPISSDKKIAEQITTGNTIEITSAGFSPKTLTVNKGDTVTFVNKDSQPHWPASAVHPTHTAYPSSGITKCDTDEKDNIFDACRGLGNGETFRFTFSEEGSWGYHDHLGLRHTGTIIVK